MKHSSLKVILSSLILCGCGVAGAQAVSLRGIIFWSLAPATNEPALTAAGVESPLETGEEPPPITTESGPDEMALATHLQQVQAKMYGVYWCPHCHAQESLFGKQAFTLINYIECDPRGKNGRPDLCQAANIVGYPTWEINGKFYSGVQSLEELATYSQYTGRQNFQNPFPYSRPKGR